jgi:para-nitrobenzyl esterase
MENNRRDFIKTIGRSAAFVGLGGVTLPSRSNKENKNETTPEQVLEISENGAIIETNFGKVRGYRRNGIYTYKGIPYGASTAGANRFMAPKEPEKWTDVRNALFWGPSSPQNSGRFGNSNNYKEIDTDHFCGAFTYHWSDLSYGEDCLRINIWTPSINDNQKRPVLVWFHGGGFAHGSSINLDAYIGENLSKSGDVVVCTINHRLNAFGFTNLAKLGGEQYRDSANAGMLDIVASLKWVNANISNFGGDPGNVTIFGQSGGGGKVSTILAMPSAKGLFHKAFTMSGATLKIGDFDKTAELGNAVLKEAGLNASKINKLKELSWMDYFDLTQKTQEILMKGSSLGMAGGFSPCMDNLNIPQHPFDPKGPEISAGIPMIIGSCMAEGSPSANDPSLEYITFDQVKEKVKAGTAFGGITGLADNAGKVVDAYAKCFPDKKPVEIWAMIGTRGNAVLQAERQTANGGAVYNYLFDWKTPLYDGRPRAYHNSDISFWFNNTDVMDTITGGGARPKRLAEKMSQALVSFARTGDPNHDGIPVWPRYDSKMGAVMIWDDICSVKNDPDRDARKLLSI